MHRELIYRALDRIWPDLVIVGDATGADKLVTDWCHIRKVDIVVCFALWDETTPRGKAGPDRNARMAKWALLLDGAFLTPWAHTACLHFPGGDGTAGMMAIAENHGFDMLDGLTVADLSQEIGHPWEARDLHRHDGMRFNHEWQTWDE